MTTIKHHPWSLATAIALFTLYIGYKRLTTPPSSLAHLPRADFFAVIRALIKETPADQVAKTITLPAANKANHGLYRFDNSGWTVRVTSPEAAKKLLLSHDLFPKARLQKKREGTIAGRLLVGPNVLFETGEKWKEHRKVANPAFHRSMPVALFGRLMEKLLHGELITATGDDGILNVHTLTTRWSLDAIGLSSFDFDFHALDQIDNNPWVDRYHYLVAKAKNPLFFLFPILEQKYLFLFPDRQNVHNELSIFLGMMNDIISKKKQLLQQKDAVNNRADNEKDLLTLMIEAENDGQGRLSNDELLSNLCVFFLAGHDTTASALAYAIYYLAVNPSAQDKARKEALAVLGNDPIPSLDQMRSLSFINMVIKETLRLNPPAVSIIPREATRDTELNGVFIPKGTRVSLDIIDLQRNPAVWQDPDVFRPERFAPGGEAEQLTRNGMPWVPFSDGARKCIGSNFSLMEQRVFLTMLLREYEWSLPEDSIHNNGLITHGLGATQPKDLYIKFAKRS
ncbi:cytochrome p450 [Lichtheimia corymbifera JMRC:FSU:9682]|uniref:Cytochrome p450 n=1 Tax=Lichtheimia corymbifera JMRC:FSU:9682 TaxID=1263082 RepID=A0A068RR59_9FUNG|nr:cytochrome p450 [Lichtheimia corymbifera JMRC:FSU:9682]